MFDSRAKQYRASPLRSRPSWAHCSGWLAFELALWLVGIGLILAYVVTDSRLESQRQHGIERFAQAQVEAGANQVLDALPSDLNTRSASAEPAQPVPASAPNESDELPIAVLRIPRLGLEVPVYADISELNLSRGAGWIGGTAAPNSDGNMAIAAHRDRYFRPLKDIKEGDTLELESLSGRSAYRVDRVAIVNPSDVSVLDATAASTVTLVTCYPFYFIGNAPQRFIVQATAVERTGKASKAGVVPTKAQSGDTS